MKKNRNGLIAWGGVIVFLLLIALAIVFESAYTLYVASILPIIVVPFIPDIPANQWLTTSNKKSGFRIYRTTPNAGDLSGLVVIECNKGAIRWKRNKLYFSMEGLPVEHLDESSRATTLPVLAYDLLPHRRRKNSYGINLQYLCQRMATLAIEPNQVTRLIIRMEDLQHFQQTKSVSGTTAVGNGVQV